MALRFAVLALIAATASAVYISPQETEKNAKEGMLKLMNLGYGIAESVKKTTNEHAYRLGENMGMHIAEDQENGVHGVDTKLAAAREGMKDSIQEATSLLQEGVHEARGILEDKGIRVAAENVMKPIRENPQFGYFANFLEENLQKGDAMVDETLNKMETGLPDEHARNFLKGLHSSFMEGAESEQKHLMEQAKLADEGKATESIHTQKEHGDIMQQKANTLIEKAAALASIALDKAPGVLKEATDAAKQATL